MTERSRGALGHGYTVVTPGNHYPSRLPEFGDQPVVKLVTPRMVPSRIGQYLVSLDAGGGTYVLGDAEHEVRAEDFIYMAPYCPQGFTASADGPAEYLLYKDPWRDGF
jgi:glyoxylate utilization-related uncharacterized protein